MLTLNRQNQVMSLESSSKLQAPAAADVLEVESELGPGNSAQRAAGRRVMGIEWGGGIENNISYENLTQ